MGRKKKIEELLMKYDKTKKKEQAKKDRQKKKEEKKQRMATRNYFKSKQVQLLLGEYLSDDNQPPQNERADYENKQNKRGRLKRLKTIETTPKDKIDDDEKSNKSVHSSPKKINNQPENIDDLMLELFGIDSESDEQSQSKDKESINHQSNNPEISLIINEDDNDLLKSKTANNLEYAAPLSYPVGMNRIYLSQYNKKENPDILQMYPKKVSNPLLVFMK